PHDGQPPVVVDDHASLQGRTTLIVANWPLDPSGETANRVRLAFLLAASRRLLRPGGCLVLVVAVPAGTVAVPEDFPDLIGTASTRRTCRCGPPPRPPARYSAAAGTSPSRSSTRRGCCPRSPPTPSPPTPSPEIWCWTRCAGSARPSSRPSTPAATESASSTNRPGRISPTRTSPKRTPRAPPAEARSSAATPPA